WLWRIQWCMASASDASAYPYTNTITHADGADTYSHTDADTYSDTGCDCSHSAYLWIQHLHYYPIGVIWVQCDSWRCAHSGAAHVYHQPGCHIYRYSGQCVLQGGHSSTDH